MAYSACYPEKAPRVDRLMKTLSSAHRREVILYFESCSRRDVESLEIVASHIDGRMPATSPAELEKHLHHKHLPKLEEHGWVEYDSREGTIHYQGAEDAESLLSDLVTVFSE